MNNAKDYFHVKEPKPNLVHCVLNLLTQAIYNSWHYNKYFSVTGPSITQHAAVIVLVVTRVYILMQL